MPDEVLPLAGRQQHVYVARPAEPTGRAVVVLHELLGLNDDIRRISDRFAQAGYLVMAPDLFQELGAKPFCMARAMGQLAKGGGEVLAVIEALAGHLAEREEVERGAIGVAGFCMGGGFAVLAAGGGHFDVAAPFYGGVPRSKRGLPRLCPTVASFGGRDIAFRHGAERLRDHLADAGVDHDVKVYPGAGHSFMSEHPEWLGHVPPMYAGHDPAAAEDAWARMLGFFDRVLPGGPAG